MHTLAVIASAWRWNVPGLVCCSALLAAYTALAGLHPSRTLAWFLAGIVFLAVVVCSPLDLMARQYLLTAEAIEQMLIALVASYLFLLGTPESAARRLRLDRLHVPYYLAWIAGMAVLSIWYLPRLLTAALASNAVRGLEYAVLLAGGAVFWWPIHSPLPEQRIRLVPTSLVYLAAATVWCSLLGLVLAFAQPSGHYLRYVDTLHIADSLVTDWSLTPENDQQTAGLLFWIGATAVLLTEVMLVYYRWYISPEVRDEFESNGKTVPAPPGPAAR
jgi:cytochrome c oxidase assembly factor CtaG